MEIDFQFQPNCSECALVVYSDKINKKQEEFLKDFFRSKNIDVTITPLGNVAVETEYGTNTQYKDDLWKLRDLIEEISKFNKINVEEHKHFDLIRDDSWYDMVEEKRI